MAGFIESVKEKVVHFQTHYKNQDLSAYRIFRFLFSRKGVYRISRFIFKIVRSLYFRLFGIRLKNDFELWLKKNQPSKGELREKQARIANFKNQPTISIILPVYNPTLLHLQEAVKSVENQIYEKWELCIADDASTHPDVLDYLNKIASNEQIKVIFRKENGHIVHTSNDALTLATGDYVLFLDHDDKLSPHCLFSFVEALQEEPQTDFLYADEGKFDDKGIYDHPFFKPDWSPDTLESRNYILHPICVKHDLIKQVGGFRPGFEGAQDYDLVLRLTEVAQSIVHLTQVLYFWRMHANSTADLDAIDVKNYAFEAQERALKDAFQRRKQNVEIEVDRKWKGVYHPRYILDELPKVSVIIPAHNQPDVTRLCLETLFTNTAYPNFDVLVLSNNSSDPAFFELMKEFETKYPTRFKWFEQNYKFNYSKLMNAGFKAVDGALICHLNNDVEIIHSDWMLRMAEQAMRKEIGAVGAKLLYPNRLVQHAGVVIGLHGCAGHAFVAAKEDAGGPYFQLAANTNYAAVTGACLMVHRDKYEEIDGFDELQVVEYNDIDFCLRLLTAGYRNLYLSSVVLIHHESLSRGHPHKDSESYTQHIHDTSRFTKNWGRYMKNDPYYSPHLSRRHTHFVPKTSRYD